MPLGAGIRTALVGGLALVAAAPNARAQVHPVQTLIWRCGADGRERGLSGGTLDTFVQACVDDGERRLGRAAGGGRAGERGSPAADGRLPPEGTWTYGPHPVLGVSAHVTVGGESLAFACAAGRGPRTDGYTVIVRATPGLLRETGSKPLLLLDGPPSGGGMIFSKKDAYFEHRDDSCGIDLKGYRKAKAVLVLSGELSVSTEGGVTTIVVQQPDNHKVTIVKDADLAALRRVTRLPLTGSRAATDRLLAACPILRADLANGCGDG